MLLVLLDIDGVLNSARSFVGLGSSYPPREPFDAAAQFSDGTERPTHPTFDPVAVGLLRRLVTETGASVYVHSSWANRRTGAYFRDLFRVFYGWDAPILERTGTYYFDRRDRIQDAIDRYEPTRFVVLDDEDLAGAFGTHAVVVDSGNGLSIDDFNRAREVLTGVPASVLILP